MTSGRREAIDPTARLDPQLSNSIVHRQLSDRCFGVHPSVRPQKPLYQLGWSRRRGAKISLLVLDWSQIVLSSAEIQIIPNGACLGPKGMTRIASI
jgi:hypothetical protein